MHLSIDRLLILRDSGPADVAHLEHLRSCVECSQTLESLRARRQLLSELADIEPPTDAWSKVQDELARPVSQSNRRAAAWVVSMIAVIGALIFTVRLQNQPPNQVAVVGVEKVTDATAMLVAQSQELEQVLHQLPGRPYVQRAATAAAIDDLETSIQLVDAQLSSPDMGNSNTQSEQLWQKRVELMTSLVNVRYAQASRFYL
jgi:hypothetical protein